MLAIARAVFWTLTANSNQLCKRQQMETSERRGEMGEKMRGEKTREAEMEVGLYDKMMQ